jgi:hypothetical protein
MVLREMSTTVIHVEIEVGFTAYNVPHNAHILVRSQLRPFWSLYNDCTCSNCTVG